MLAALAPLAGAADRGREEQLLRRALEIRRAALGPDHPDVASSLASLGSYHYHRGENERAEGFFRQALDVFRGPQGRRNPIAIATLNEYASVMIAVNRHAEAEALEREAIELAQQILGAESMMVADLLNSLATIQAYLGRHVEAERSFRRAYETHVALVGEEHWRTRNVARNVGRALALQRRYAEALPWMDRSIVVPAGRQDEGRVGSWGKRAQRAEVLFRLGRREEALAEATVAVSALERAGEVATWPTRRGRWPRPRCCWVAC